MFYRYKRNYQGEGTKNSPDLGILPTYISGFQALCISVIKLLKKKKKSPPPPLHDMWNKLAAPLSLPHTIWENAISHIQYSSLEKFPLPQLNEGGKGNPRGYKAVGTIQHCGWYVVV